MQALQRTGKPVVFIMQTGSSLAVKWESEHLPAILNVWYGGQAVGQAVADVLWGDYNPAGRLPITFYASDDDLPPYEDYSMRGRTYRYFDKKALFPFGYGLSYTTFRYGKLKMPARLERGKNLTVEVEVTNTGKCDGDEVVQLYVTHHTTDYTVPLCALKEMKRIHLKRNETRKLQFELPVESLQVVSGEGTALQVPETLSVFVGGGQPAFSGGVSGNVRVK